MKKFYTAVLFLSMTVIATNLEAQTAFAPVGAEWWFEGQTSDFNPGQWGYTEEYWTDHMVVAGDTLLSGIPCRKMVATRYKKRVDNPNVVTTSAPKIFYVYDNTDTVFVYNHSSTSFSPLYIFNAQEGDTIRLPIPDAARGDFPDTGKSFAFIVDSIRLEKYDTSHLRSFYTRTLIDSGVEKSWNWGRAHVNLSQPGNQWINIGKYTEVIGGNWKRVGGTFPMGVSHNVDFPLDFAALPAGAFRCHTDTARAIHMFPTKACNSFTDITDLNAVTLGIKVYPNPFHDFFNIAIQKPLPESLNIKINDLNGRLIYETILPAGKMEVSCHPGKIRPGLYFLLLQTRTQKYYQKMLVGRNILED